MEQSQPIASPVTPHVTVHDASGAIEFYKRAFGAREMMRMPMPNSAKLAHAAVSINGGMVMLADAFEEMGEGAAPSPKRLGGTPVTIHLNLPDVDATWKQAVEEYLVKVKGGGA